MRKHAEIPDSSVSVAVISHNYGRFLPDALDSVLSQSYPPGEILVIDDASSDDTADVARAYASLGVGYLKVHNHNVFLNRLLAAQTLSGKWVLCLDADNVLSPDYLEAAVHIGDLDKKCACVYPSLKLFGEDTRLRNLSSPAANVFVQNFVDASALYRREAILQSSLASRRPLPEISAEDWVTARQIVSEGWSTQHSPSLLHYRVHSDNKHTRRHKTIGFRDDVYFNDAALYDESVTVVILLSGRDSLWPMTQRWLNTQAWPAERLKLMLVDNSHDAAFGRKVKRWAFKSKFCDVRYVTDRRGKQGLGDEVRTGRPDHDRLVHRTVAALYNNAFRESTTEYVLTLEDDIKPPLDTIELLLRGMDHRTAAVTGAYKHRDQSRFLVWGMRGDSRVGVTPKDSGIDDIAGCGFGCLLVRKSVTDQIQLATDGRSNFYDANACEDIAALGWLLRVNWSVQCDHLAGCL